MINFEDAKHFKELEAMIKGGPIPRNRELQPIQLNMARLKDNGEDRPHSNRLTYKTPVFSQKENTLKKKLKSF